MTRYRTALPFLARQAMGAVVAVWVLQGAGPAESLAGMGFVRPVIAWSSLAIGWVWAPWVSRTVIELMSE